MVKSGDTTARGKHLRVLEKAIQLTVANKLIDSFAEVEVTSESEPLYQAQIITVIGRALGETLNKIEVPAFWKRFVKRKDCPKYLKEIITYRANVYYPKISLPKEKHYITFDIGENHSEVKAKPKNCVH